MKRQRLALESVIAAAATVTGIYLASLVLEAPARWVLGFCLLANVSLVWMVIRILKDPFATAKTFDEYFYQDRCDLRRSGED
jgi:hypothetical protein